MPYKNIILQAFILVWSVVIANLALLLSYLWIEKSPFHQSIVVLIHRLILYRLLALKLSELGVKSHVFKFL
jgi:hypothetical protein